MSWAEINQELERRRVLGPSGMFRSSVLHEGLDYTPQEVIDEVAAIVSDTARFFAELPEKGAGAFMPAQLVASWRDHDRPGSLRHGSLGDLASLFAGWLVERPDGEDFAANLQAVQLALDGSPTGAASGERLARVRRGLSGRFDQRRAVRASLEEVTAQAATPAHRSTRTRSSCDRAGLGAA